MPDIGVFHPQIVHFVIAFLILGVLARLVSLLPLPERFRFVGPMAAALIILGTVASVAAVQSGKNAHGPVERVPGAREAVVEHEEWGERVRNAFLGIAAFELAALAFSSRRGVAQGLRVVSALAGLAGLWVLYEASEHGGELVYGYAGGVGIRSGQPADLKRLLVAGLYHNARAARDSGRKQEAARLTRELLVQMPDDWNVRFLGIESQIEDHDDPRGALAALAALDVPADDVRLQIRRAMLSAQAFQALGAADSAQGVVRELQARLPDNPRVKAAVERMSRPEGGPR
ncbi:MAG: DUF2231 domain-containing protein [Candidatus Eiseniibacteriota bacterium]